MQHEAGTPRWRERGTTTIAARRSARQADGIERALVWSVVAAVHVMLFWGAGRLLVAPTREETSAPLALIFLPAPQPQRALPIAAPPPRAVASRPRSSVASAPRARATAIVAPRPESPSPSDAVAPAGLIVVEIPPASAPSAPWDQPAANAFEPPTPRLPGQGAQRFKMAPPRSLANTVERVGALFGGRGEDPCARTRDNIHELGVQGDSAALRREVEYERRYCRP